jgi:hypothetical protein
MKWTTRIMVAMLVLLVTGLLVSNMQIKNEYDKLDKTDTYWTYEKITEQHFRYLKIEGGNITKIAFEQNPNCSVRVLNDWQRYHPELIKTEINNDTLFIHFVYTPQNMGEKTWMGWTTLVRVSAPELAYVRGHDTKMEMFKLKQKSIGIDMSGKSSFEIESMTKDLDSVRVSQRDSSEVVIEMSPEFKSAESLPVSDSKVKMNINGMGRVMLGQKIKSNESMNIASVNARVEGNSLLDIGHAQISNLQLRVSDSSGVILSGGALKKITK